MALLEEAPREATQFDAIVVSVLCEFEWRKSVSDVSCAEFAMRELAGHHCPLVLLITITKSASASSDYVDNESGRVEVDGQDASARWFLTGLEIRTSPARD